jgi:hypothetical protein
MSVADLGVRRPAEEALAADELRRDIHPAGIAADIHVQRPVVAAPMAALDAADDSASAPWLRLVE